MATKDKKPVSAEKVAANRANAQKSTGPRTEEGKRKSAQNSWRHGFYSKHLFYESGNGSEGREDYETIINGLRDHYQPQGFLENLWLQKIAAELIRSARVLSHEHLALTFSLFPFGTKSVDRIVRYQAANSRQLAQAIKELETLQAKRKEKATRDPLPDGNPMNFDQGQMGAPEQPADGEQSRTESGDPASGNLATDPTVACETTDPIDATTPLVENYGTKPNPIEPSLDNRPLEADARTEGVRKDTDLSAEPSAAEDIEESVGV